MPTCSVHGELPADRFYPNNKTRCKTCISERNRNYVKRNPEKVASYRREYSKANRSEISGRQSRWYQENREAVKTDRQSYYLANKEKILIRGREYWAENVERFAETSKKYREKLDALDAQYRAELRREAIRVYSGDLFNCAGCGTTSYPTLCLDHLENNGGRHRRENSGVDGGSVYRWVKIQGYPKIFQVLCYNCNYIKYYDTIPHPKNTEGNRRRKRIVMEHYSNGKLQCVECGVRDIRVLTIDHVGGKGRQHLRSIGVKGGSQFYKWLVRHGFPEGFRTLCFNCNCSKNSKSR